MHTAESQVPNANKGAKSRPVPLASCWWAKSLQWSGANELCVLKHHVGRHWAQGILAQAAWQGMECPPRLCSRKYQENFLDFCKPLLCNVCITGNLWQVYKCLPNRVTRQPTGSLSALLASKEHMP